MGFFDWFRRAEPMEKRSSATGFTAEIMAARESYLAGRTGIADLTSTVQSCVSLWENGLSISTVDGTDMLDRRTMAMIGRSLALRGEAVFLISDDRLIPASDWELATRNGSPIAYRVSISEAGGATSRTALAAEVLHVRIGCDPAAPWLGSAPLKRARLTAGLLQAIESALAEIYETAPIGSQIIPFPESGETDLETLGRGFRGQRGRVLLRESVTVSAAGGPAPQADWRPVSTTPDLTTSLIVESLAESRNGICGAFGVLPALFDSAAQGPMIREAQRHLAQWTLSPIAALLSEEASEKLGTSVAVDVFGPTDAYDVGGKARAAGAVVEMMARAKEAGLSPGDVGAALRLVDWSE